VAFEELNQYRSVEELTNVRTVIVNERKALNDEYDGLPFTIEAGEQFAAKTETIEEIDRRVTELQARARLVADSAADEEKTEPGSYTAPAIIKRPSIEDIYDTVAIERNSRNREERDQKYRDHAMRAAEQLRVASPRYDQDKSRERLQQLIDFVDSDDKEIAQRVLTTNSPQYRAAFNRYVKSGGQERAAALAVGVDGTGGFSVPVSFDPTIIAIGAWTAINPYRTACKTVTISGTDTWQALTATAITAAYALEAAAATEQGPTFARPEYIAKRAHAFVTASYEMAQDRADLPSELGTLFGEAKDNLEENQYTLGVGTTVFPQGTGLKDAYTRTDTATTAVLVVGDVRAVEAALPIRHRMNAAWFLSRAAIRFIQGLETVGGQLFNGSQYPSVGNPQSNRTGNTGLQLLGYPVWETPSMTFTPTVADSTWGVLANPQTYVIVDRIGMSVKVIPDMLNGATPSFPTGEIGIYAFWRNTARVLNVDGGRQGGIL
jgi:HK97 family phage major capsid protein